MKEKLTENFKLKLVNNEIINSEEIINAISIETNIDMLKEYYEFIATKMNPYLYKNMDKIINALQSKLKKEKEKDNKLEKELEKIENTYIEFEEIIPILYKYTNNIQLTEEETLKIYAFISNDIALYEKEFDESLDPREREIFHYTMEYIRDKEKNNIEEYMLNRYNTSCQKEIETNGKTNSYTKRLLNPDTPLLLSDENGITATIIIISITVMIGLFLAAFLLVK